MNLVLAVTGATGSLAAKILSERSPWKVDLVASTWGKQVYEHECGPFGALSALADRTFDDGDLAAPISSGSVPTAGMVILPCSSNTLAAIAAGLADSLVTRAAHCHLKEGRRLVLCVRETPWTLIDCENARRVAAAGAVVMPVSPPFYMEAGRDAGDVSLLEITTAFVDRVLAVLGHDASRNWETVR